jgi:hypothetical protein
MQLLGLQINAEKYYFGIRKSLVEFDEVLEVHVAIVAFCSIFGFLSNHQTKYELTKLFLFTTFIGPKKACIQP